MKPVPCAKRLGTPALETRASPYQPRAAREEVGPGQKLPYAFWTKQIPKQERKDALPFSVLLRARDYLGHLSISGARPS